MKCYICGSTEAEEFPRLQLTHNVRCPVCGSYSISDMVIVIKVIEHEVNRRHLISAMTRQASDAGNPIIITSEKFEQLLDSLPGLSTPLDNLDRTLLYVNKQQTRADEFVALRFSIDYPLVFARDGAEFIYFAGMLSNQGFLEAKTVGEFAQVEHGVRLTPNGWQRVIELQKTQRDSDQAFVAMWFDTGLADAWNFGIKPALELTGFKPYRVDLEEHNQKIDDRIIAEIRRSGLLVADFTGHRGGVYFEAGFAMGLGIPVIWSCKQEDIDKAHFDTRQYSHVVWTDPNDLKAKLSNRIAAIMPGRYINQT